MLTPMWPLIIPPIVLVLSLGFLVWFLSKKRRDPAFEAHLAELGERKRSRFLSLLSHDWFLKLLERLLQHLKLSSLKLHNRFQEFSRWLRERRVAKQHEVQAESVAPQSDISLETEDKERFWDRWHRRHRVEGASEALSPIETPPLTSSDEATDRIAVEVVKEPEVKRTLAGLVGLKKKVSALGTEGSEYFSRHKRTTASPKKLLSEEELIDRIAKNPKDAASYEELGDYYLATENLEDAKACYRQVIKLSPLNREVKDKVRKLERLLVQREKHKG